MFLIFTTQVNINHKQSNQRNNFEVSSSHTHSWFHNHIYSFSKKKKKKKGQRPTTYKNGRGTRTSRVRRNDMKARVRIPRGAKARRRRNDGGRLLRQWRQREKGCETSATGGDVMLSKCARVQRTGRGQWLRKGTNRRMNKNEKTQTRKIRNELLKILNEKLKIHMYKYFKSVYRKFMVIWVKRNHQNKSPT